VTDEPRIDVDVAGLRFGDAMYQLEAIVRELESGDLDLEESLERYERGVELLQVCRARLAAAESKVTSLLGEIERDTEETP
jgi:exodeoxyribonuclease VII small subunit